MNVQNIINELTSRKTELEQSGGNARDRINNLLDTASFVEVGGFIKHRSTDFNLSVKDTPADGVVTGYGTIEGRLVYVYSQDSAVLGGALGEMHAKKICNIYDMAIKMGAPIIALIDSAGLRLQESLDALDGFGTIFYKQTLASGVVPQITAILGNCGGGATLIPSLSDFTFMTKKDSSLFVNSPNALDDKSATKDTVASADFHSKETGIVDFVCDDETNCLESIRSLVNILPANNMEEALADNADDLNRVSSELNTLIPDNESKGFDVRDIITAIADNNVFIETKTNFDSSMVTGLFTLGGITVGVVANQSLDNDGFMTSTGCEKGAKLVTFCDAFDIPVLSITDVAGFNATMAEEKAGISKNVSKLLYAFANATIPKINVVVRKAYGSAYLAMNSKHIGADLVYAWPTAKISLMNADSAVKIMYSDEIKESNTPDNVINEKVTEYDEIQSSPYVAASRGYIDDIIEPAATRKRVIAALEMLYTKREVKPTKKHSSI